MCYVCVGAKTLAVFVSAVGYLLTHTNGKYKHFNLYLQTKVDIFCRKILTVLFMTGEKLKKIIAESGYTMASAARLLDMTPQHLNQAVSVADVKSGLLEKFSAAFGISIAALYGETAGVAITGSGNTTNGNDSAVVNRFLSIIEEKDRQIAQLLKMLEK